MSFLLDTNVISESARARPDRRVMEWLASVDEEQLFLSIITSFRDRLLHADVGTADSWGRIVASAEAHGKPIGEMDTFIAAIAGNINSRSLPATPRILK